MLVAGILVLVLIVGAAVAAFLVFSGSSHEISTPSTAGGMKRDTKREQMLETQLSAARKQFQTQLGSAKYVRSAVYLQDDSKRGPKGPLVFLGAHLEKQRSSTDWINTFHKNATANGFKVTDTQAGDGGGKGVCAEQDANGQRVAICAWATDDSIGELIPTVPGYSSSNLGSLMRALRSDVES